MFPLLRYPAWMEDARCQEVEPELFFPDPGANPNRAREVCAECPVKAPCLEFALANESGTSHSSRFGVYAGLTPQQRADIERRKTA